MKLGDFVRRDPKKRMDSNLEHWRASGEPRRWVEEHDFRWNHGDWLALLDVLKASKYWPMDTDAVGAVLEDLKREFWVTPKSAGKIFSRLREVLDSKGIPWARNSQFYTVSCPSCGAGIDSYSFISYLGRLAVENLAVSVINPTPSMKCPRCGGTIFRLRFSGLSDDELESMFRG